MRKAKIILSVWLVFFMLGFLFCNIQIGAKEINIAIPKIRVKTIKKGTGVKIIVSKTDGATGYVIQITGSKVQSAFKDRRTVRCFGSIS